MATNYYLFTIMLISVFLRANIAFTDSLTLYEAFWHNRMIEGIETRQKEATQNSKDQKSLFFIYESEYQLLEDFLAKYPQNLFLHYNFGVLWLSEDIQKTIMQFLFTLKAKNPDELKFRAAFNLGTLYGYDKRLNSKSNNYDYIDQALKYYQAALKIKPDSLKTRQNIEMLFLRQASQQQQEEDSKKQDNAKQDTSQQDQSGEDKNASYKNNKKDKQEEQKFQSKNLTKRDVQDILEELKQQEQQIWERLIQNQDKKQRDQKKRKGRNDWMSKDIFNQETSEDQDLDKDW